MKGVALTLIFFSGGLCAALGQSKSSSANYELLHALTGGGGQVSNGSDIAADISIGESVAGTVSNVTASGVQSKPNYIGQLYDVSAITLSASSTNIDEGGSRQLSAVATMDDATTLDLAGTDVQWAVVLGPLTGIDASGLATAGVVYTNTAATAQGTYQGVDGQLALTIVNIDDDNFDGYAGDGLGDSWQVMFFGDPPNADAAPGANPDQDPHDNQFEYLTGYDPTDSGEFFFLKVADRSGTTNTLELSKIIAGTRYRVERSSDLDQADPWSEFANFTTLSEVLEHQLEDTNAVGDRWFYRVGVEAE